MAQARRFLLNSSLARAITGSNHRMPYAVAPASPSLPSAFSLKRFFSEAKLFVGGLSFRTTEESLKDCFAEHGEVSDVRIITDRDTGRSRGFGFVTYYNESDAETALSKLQGHLLDGRSIRVDKAATRSPGGKGMASTGLSPGLNDEPEPPVDPAEWGSLPSLNADISGSDSGAKF